MFEGYGDPAALSLIITGSVFGAGWVQPADAVGVRVGVAVFVAVAVNVGVGVEVAVGVKVGVFVGVVIQPLV